MIMPQAIVIGASAGAIEALATILSPLPADYPVPIIVVVHIPPHKDSKLASVFQNKCRINACEAEDKQTIEAGTVYFAPPNYHLLVEQDGFLSLSSEEEILFSRPSIDVLFESAADAYGSNLLGIILTGANEDGSNGLKAVVSRHGTAIVQDPLSAAAAAMPRAAIKMVPEALILPPNEIAAYLMRFTCDRVHNGN